MMTDCANLSKRSKTQSERERERESDRERDIHFQLAVYCLVYWASAYRVTLGKGGKKKTSYSCSKIFRATNTSAEYN